MAVLTGGLRDRMLLQCVTDDIVANLVTRGWYGVERSHKPFTVVDEYPNDGDDVAENTIAFSLGDTVSRPLELGSAAEILSVPIFVDMFAESDALGRHVVGDIHEFVAKQGKFVVKDLREDPPTAEFTVLLVDGTIERSKPARAVNSWQKNWHTVAFVVIEERKNT